MTDTLPPSHVVTQSGVSPACGLKAHCSQMGNLVYAETVCHVIKKPLLLWFVLVVHSIPLHLTPIPFHLISVPFCLISTYPHSIPSHSIVQFALSSFLFISVFILFHSAGEGTEVQSSVGRHESEGHRGWQILHRKEVHFWSLLHNWQVSLTRLAIGLSPIAVRMRGWEFPKQRVIVHKLDTLSHTFTETSTRTKMFWSW